MVNPVSDRNEILLYTIQWPNTKQNDVNDDTNDDGDDGGMWSVDKSTFRNAYDIQLNGMTNQQFKHRVIWW